MATFLNRLCKNAECDSHKKQTMLGDPYRALCEVVGASKENYQLKCGTCNAVFEDKRPEVRRTGGWPHYNASADRVFDSYTDQRMWEKKTGAEPM